MAHAIQQALMAAGLTDLPPAAQHWVAARVRRWGHVPEAVNIGGLCCTRPHRHGTGGCVEIATAGGVRHLAQFHSWDDAARCLVATARRAAATPAAPEPDLVISGYTSTHPIGDETAGPWDTVKEGAKEAGILALGLPAELTSLWLTEPTAEAEALFRGLLADWEGFERSGVPKGVPELKLDETYTTWTQFRDAWLRGDPDESSLAAQVADANKVRRLLAERAGQLKPGEVPPDLRQGIDITQTRAPLAAAASVDTKARLWSQTAREGLAKLPTEYKVLAAVAGGGVLLYLSAPLLLALSNLRGGRTVVEVNSPRRARR